MSSARHKQPVDMSRDELANQLGRVQFRLRVERLVSEMLAEKGAAPYDLRLLRSITAYVLAHVEGETEVLETAGAEARQLPTPPEFTGN